MGPTATTIERTRVPRVEPRPGAGGRGARMRRVEALSVAILVLMTVASTIGVSVDGLYPDGPWAREALRGGDLTTLALVVPALAASLLLARRGSAGARVVWLGALAYGVYNYAYFAFGAEFNAIFPLHVVLLTASIATLLLAATTFDLRAIAERVRVPGARWVGLFLAIVGSVLGGLWIALSIRHTVSGELIGGLPEDGVHLVFAIDTSLLGPALVIAGVLLWRRSEVGFAAGATMAVMGAMYQVNLLAAGAFQAAAEVPGAKAFPPEGVGLAVGFLVATLVLLGRRPSTVGR
ncbi:MAG TPA: hypothetical protein VF108_03385 [Actinomycetota bacterium]